MAHLLTFSWFSWMKGTKAHDAPNCGNTLEMASISMGLGWRRNTQRPGCPGPGLDQGLAALGGAVPDPELLPALQQSTGDGSPQEAGSKQGDGHGVGGEIADEIIALIRTADQRFSPRGAHVFPRVLHRFSTALARGRAVTVVVWGEWDWIRQGLLTSAEAPRSGVPWLPMDEVASPLVAGI